MLLQKLGDIVVPFFSSLLLQLSVVRKTKDTNVMRENLIYKVLFSIKRIIVSSQ